MRWEQGRAEIDAQLAEHRLQRVPPSREHADRLLGQAKRHLESAQATAATDPEGAYALLYDAARKALVAILENQGLRPTRSGGHVVAYQAVAAQLHPPLGAELRPFDRMRRQRHSAEYPASDAPELTGADIEEDIPKVQVILSIASDVLDRMSPYE